MSQFCLSMFMILFCPGQRSNRHHALGVQPLQLPALPGSLTSRDADVHPHWLQLRDPIDVVQPDAARGASNTLGASEPKAGGPPSPQGSCLACWQRLRRPLGRVGLGEGKASSAHTSTQSFPRKSCSEIPRVCRWVSVVRALIHSTGVPPPTPRMRFSTSMCLRLGGRFPTRKAETTLTPPLAIRNHVAGTPRPVSDKAEGTGSERGVRGGRASQSSNSGGAATNSFPLTPF